MWDPHCRKTPKKAFSSDWLKAHSESASVLSVCLYLEGMERRSDAVMNKMNMPLTQTQPDSRYAALKINIRLDSI